MRKFIPIAFTSAFAIALLFTASGLMAQYCLPTYNNPCSSDDFIDNVAFGTISNLATGCTGTAPNNYTNYSATLSTSMQAGTSQNISVKPGASWGQYFVAFIDLNNDLDFADPGEFFNIGYAGAGVTINAPIAIPSATLAGTKRMRVMCRFGTTPLTAADSCATGLSYGETEDYGLVITAAAANDAGVTALTAPVSGCGLSATEQVTIDYVNAGSSAMSNFQLCYSINGAPQVCETITTSVPAQSTASYTFTATADLSTAGPYTFVIKAILPGDGNGTNDSITNLQVNSIPLISNFPYSEDFAAGSGGWVSSTTGGTPFALGTPAKVIMNTAASDSNSWITGLTGLYAASTFSWVTSPCIDMSTTTNAWISMSVWWQSEFSWDGAVLQSSTDGGTTWVAVGANGDPFNWFNDNTINGLVSGGASGSGWSGRITSNNGSGGWVTAMHPLSGLNAQPGVRFRVVFGSDGSVNDEGFAFDDILIANASVASLGPDTTVCGGIVLNPQISSPNATAWSTGDTTNTIFVDSTGTYSVMVLDSNGFPAMDTVNITVVPTVAADAGPDRSACMNSTVCLAVDSSFASVLWSNGDTTAISCVTMAGTYTVMTTDSNGCTSSDSITVNALALPSVNLGADTTLCSGDQLCLDAGPGASSYTWSNGDTSQVSCVTTAMSYSVVVTDTNNCAGSDSVLITGASAPTAMASTDTSACPVIAFADMSTDSPTSWMWDFGDGNTSTTQNASNDYAAAGNGSYTVTLITTNDCGSDTTSMIVDITCVVGIENGWDLGAVVYPNPNTGRFTLQMQLIETENLRLEVVNLQGQTIFRQESIANAGPFRQELNLNDVAAGTYFLRIMSGDRMVTKKLFVE
jgi:PKD repeat protein